MIRISALFNELITKIRREGIIVALRAVCNFLKYRLIVCYYNTFHHGLALRNIQGSKMYLFVNDLGLSQELLFHGIREPLQTNLVKQLVKPGMTVVDIGANLGYYALIEASIVGEPGKVYAIEPVPFNYEILKKSIHKNNYEGIVETRLCALSDTCGISKMVITRESNLPTMFLNENETSDDMKERIETRTIKTLEVKTTTLDKFLKGKAPVDFIRMDVEGYEGRIIKGMLDTVRKSGDWFNLFIELHPALFGDPQGMVKEIIQVLAGLGLKVKFIVNSEGTELLDFSRDNLLETLCSERAPGVFWEKT